MAELTLAISHSLKLIVLKYFGAQQVAYTVKTRLVASFKFLLNTAIIPHASMQPLVMVAITVSQLRRDLAEK